MDRYAYKATPTTPIFILVTGQSNVQGLSAATTPVITASDPDYPHVWDFGTINPYVAGPQSITPADFSWQHPNPALARVTDTSIFPYIGYQRGDTGHVGVALGYDQYRETGRDAYVLTIGMGGAALKYWQAAIPLVKNLLETFVPYVLANTPALSGVTAPDIIVWGQSEGNALATAVPYSADYLTPLAYKDDWISVRNSGYGIWSDEAISDWYLMEPTQYVNWTGSPEGSPGDIEYDYPFQWSGIYTTAQYGGDNVTFVSSTGITWETTGPSKYIHFDGDGLNAYGRRISQAFFGKNEICGFNDLFCMPGVLQRTRGEIRGALSAGMKMRGGVASRSSASGTVEVR